jgi:hypothetical protein
MKLNNDAEFLKRRTEAYKLKKDDSGDGNRDFLFKEKVPLFQSHDGENIIRIIPAGWEDALFPWKEVWVHYQIGANNSQYLCPAKCSEMSNYACPICEAGKELATSGADQEKVRPFYAQHRAIAWLIDRADPDKGPQIWVMPYKKIAQQIIKVSMKRNGEPVFVDNVKEGWDIIFSKQGKLKMTTYDGLRKDDDASPLHPDSTMAGKWLHLVEDKAIPSMLQFKSYEHIKSVLQGLAPTVQEEGPKPVTSAPKVTKKATPAPQSLNRETLEGMDRDELVLFLESRDDLNIDPDEWPTQDLLASAIALELNL